jgi:hypothetical protein
MKLNLISHIVLEIVSQRCYRPENELSILSRHEKVPDQPRWRDSKPNADDFNRPELDNSFPKRVIILIPHPDDDVISVEETLECLVDQKDDVHISCQTSGNIAADDGEVISYLSFLKDLTEECVNYEAKIEATGGIDLFIGGVGSDGHIAFNDPGSSLSSRTRIKTLTQEKIIANSRFFENDVNKVPKATLTVDAGTVIDTKDVPVLVNGHNKCRALAQAIEGAVNQMWSITALQFHPKGIIVCDEAATSEIKIGTYNYYKDIERDTIFLILKHKKGGYHDSKSDSNICVIILFNTGYIAGIIRNSLMINRYFLENTVLTAK